MENGKTTGRWNGLQRQDIRNYLKQEECKREILYRIAFALGMDYPIFSQILASVSSDGIQRPDPRRMEEIVYDTALPE